MNDFYKGNLLKEKRESRTTEDYAVLIVCGFGACLAYLLFTNLIELLINYFAGL
jgi:hypothetical protein